MEKKDSIPLPINLNCWKHHAAFIIRQVQRVKSEKEIEELNAQLLRIGESQMDLYFGKLSPFEISELIIESLKDKELLSPDKYTSWLINESKDYRLIKLPDKSIWTLRFSENPDRYVHIHPGRHSPHTIRVKATTLKTAIIIFCFTQIGEIDKVNTQEINHIRKIFLNEPPLKSFTKASGLQRLLNSFYKKYEQQFV